MIPIFLAFQTASRALAASQANIVLRETTSPMPTLKATAVREWIQFLFYGRILSFATPNYAGSLGARLQALVRLGIYL